MENKKIIRMSEIEPQEVKWLWYPYLPLGKISLIQGDAGDGKTMLILTLSALLSQGLPLPLQDTGKEPATIIYQTAEDGLEDTIRPRLEAAGADLDRIVLINDSEIPLTIADKRIEETILAEKAKLLILDPLQAFLGEDTDMHRANSVRPLFSRLGKVANKTGCAIVLVGHMNKMQGTKAMYELAVLYAEHNGTYGYRRLADEYNQRNGTAYNDKRFYRLTQLVGLKSIIRRVRPAYQRSTHGL